MLSKYQKELELIGITDLDELNDDGTFSKLMVNNNGVCEPGYVGVIEINKEGKPEIIFVRHDLNERRLVCDNFRGTYIQSDLSLLENRDPVTLFEDYSKDANTFIKIQELNKYKYYLMYKATGITQDIRNNKVLELDQQIEQLQNNLEAGLKMY